MLKFAHPPSAVQLVGVMDRPSSYLVFVGGERTGADSTVPEIGDGGDDERSGDREMTPG